MMDRLQYLSFASPVGKLLILGDTEAVHRICFQAGPSPTTIDRQWHPGGDLVGEAVRQLEEYFSGKRMQFAIPVEPKGTVFQNRVWQALGDIPYGETRSYGEQARSIGRPAASRAVGAANGRNPIPIMIPCHRVVGAKGKLTGYAGGLGIKKFLLELEESVLAARRPRMSTAKMIVPIFWSNPPPDDLGSPVSPISYRDCFVAWGSSQ